MSKTYPTVYTLDDDGEATGEVLHFCTEACMWTYLEETNSWDLHHNIDEDGDGEIVVGEICNQCGTRLDVPY